MGKKQIRLIPPAIHFLLTFIFERSILIFNDTSATRLAIPRSTAYSDKAEHIVFYVLAKIFAAILIFLLWKLLFNIFENLNKSSAVRCGIVLFLILLIVFGLFLYPDVLMRSEDNYITYAYAKRMWPEYWHSAYLSIIYAACLMIFPSPITISVVQWIGISFVAGYLFDRIKKSPVLKGRGAWLALLFLALPNTYILIVDPYRTELYAIICMLFSIALVMDAVDGVVRKPLFYVAFAVLAGFIGVMRSEGIIFGLGGFIAMLIWGYKLSFKKVVLYSLVACVAFVLILWPQKAGDEKYYGKDYTIINSFPSLTNILNAEDHNINYPGADVSLKAIDDVVPLDVVRLYGMEGYRRYNISKGRADINQSYATDEAAAAYVKGFYDLVLNNKTIYLKTQYSMWMQSLYLKEWPYYVAAVGVEEIDSLPSMSMPLWDSGKAECIEDAGVRIWKENTFRKTVAGFVENAIKGYGDGFLKKFYVRSLMMIVITLLAVIFMVKEAVLYFKKKRENTAIGVFLLILLVQYAAIVLVMPAGMQVYFHATYYSMFITELVYIIKLAITKKEKRA